MLLGEAFQFDADISMDIDFTALNELADAGMV